MIKFKNLLAIDFFLLFSTVILIIFSVLFIYSSGVNSDGVLTSNEYLRQIVWGALGLIIALSISLSNYQRIYHFAIYFYIATALLILYTCIAGRQIHGARAWIGIGIFGIQPSEFAKITTIIFLAQYLDSSHRSTNELKRFIISCLITMIPMGLVLIQPDFGTSLVFIPILLVMCFIAGTKTRYILFILAIMACTSVITIALFWAKFVLKTSVPLLKMIENIRFIAVLCAVAGSIFSIALFGFIHYKKRYFYWINYFILILICSVLASFSIGKVLKEYQINRLVVFLNPDIDPRGAGWNIIQSITAVGSGDIMGKGYLMGTQSHLRFLPQQSTDFIFSIFSEEWGFIGNLVLFTLFFIICTRLIRIMKNSTDLFGCYIAAGLSAMYSFHFLINIGMAIGIMPITGIPLLFMSYGGSALLSAMTGIGLALSIYVSRFNL
ncbi:MAG: rod shape-determining protein RodA [Spirochaetaceae bacterium]|jgi:rod shape determining protein RodA|nr:rod shape-determining protein RodA [Spirochaetaceae bacterium]